MLSYVIVQLRSNRAVAVMAAILAISSTDASVRYTEISLTERKLLKKTTSFKKQSSKVICVNTPSSWVWPDSLRARCVLLYHFG